MANITKEKLQRELALLYYNRVLRDRGIISGQECLRMGALIRSKYETVSKRK